MAQQPNFNAAQKYDRKNLEVITGTITPIPFFDKQEENFWYKFKDDNGERRYWVNAVTGRQYEMFNKSIAAKLLQHQLRLPVDSNTLTEIPDLNAVVNQQWVRFKYGKNCYRYNFVKQSITSDASVINQSALHWIVGNLSPDKKWVLFSMNHNLWLKQQLVLKSYQLTADGEPYHSFDLNETDTVIRKTESNCDAVWAGKSPYFYALRKDNRKVLTQSVVFSLASPRPRTETYKYEMPGDKFVAQYELWLGDTVTHRVSQVNIAKWADQEVEILGYGEQTNELFLLLKKRTRDEISLCAIDLATHHMREVIHEICKPYLNIDVFSAKVLDSGRKILWWSDRTGWGHFYLYQNSGKLIRQLTAGAWTAGQILRVDSAGTVYFYGYGHENARNPNYAFLYKVALNSGKLTLLTPEDGEHHVHFSPKNGYFVDTYSQINELPVTQLRRTDGKLVRVLQRPQFERLYGYGWKPPEPFVVKAADGVTNLYGLMWKPFDFDPSKKYPVISQVYPGPQTETVWTDFTVFDKYNNAPLAQIGFIVVVMGHRGGSPIRGKSYAAYGFGNLRNAPLADDKYGLEQLARRYSFMDLSRVGIFGHSGGAMMATAAICTYPDFYKVAVASSGNHDDNIYNRFWGETYQGLIQRGDTTTAGEIKSKFQFKTDVNQTLVKNLKGHLLLVTGEVDANVHPAHTYRLVDALVRAGKDFDMLVLPGQSHHYDEVYQAFFEDRLRHYFARYLLQQ